MRLATSSISIHDQEKMLGLLRLLGVPYILFGDVVLLHAPNSEWDTVTKVARRLGLTLQEFPDRLDDESLFLVVQVGALFQLHNPHVPVIVNKGRHLAVILHPKQVQEIITRRECCYTLFPLFGTQDVIKVLVPPHFPGTPQGEIQALVRDISTAKLRDSINRLVGFRTRFAFSPQYAAAAKQIEDELRLLKYTTSFQEVLVGRDRTLNIIADKIGSGPGTRNLILVTAHLDSINESDLGNAPGADDNASGCAGLLEIARVLSQQNHRHDLRFILFGGEERGLYGSKAYVQSAVVEPSRTRAVINMDMIGVSNRPSGPMAVLLESQSAALANQLARAASLYSPNLSVEWSGKCANSDHVPFVKADIPAALTIEASGDTANNFIHTAKDIPTILDFNLMVAILRMNLACVAESAGLIQPPNSKRPLNRKGMATMSDTVRQDDSSSGNAATAQGDARDIQAQFELLRTKDHLPPITLVDGSFVVTMKTKFDTTTPTGNPARPHRHPTTHPLKRMKIMDGNGVIIYENLHPEGCVIDIWLRRFFPDVEPQIRLTGAPDQNIEIEADGELLLDSRSNPVHSTRPHVYQHPANAYDIFVQHIRITSDDQILYQTDANGHAQGYEIWIWDRDLE